MGLDTIKVYFIGIIMFVLVISGGVYIVGHFTAQDSTIDSGDVSRFNNSLNKASEVTASVNAIDSSVRTASSGGTGLFGWIDAAFSSAINGLAAIGQSLSFMQVAGADASSIFGIPSFIIPLLFLVVLVIIVFAIWAAITRSP